MIAACTVLLLGVYHTWPDPRQTWQEGILGTCLLAIAGLTFAGVLP